MCLPTSQRRPIVRQAIRLLLLLCLLLGGAARSGADPALPVDSLLQQRIGAWPHWRLPAPLPRPGHGDLVYPAWFEGSWQGHLIDPSGVEAEVTVALRFTSDSDGRVVGDRAFNAASIGGALLGDALRSVRDDPANPNRQITLLSGDQRLESTVVGRREERPSPDILLADELTLQVLHGPGDPRVSRVETLSRYRRVGPDRIEGEQWQASYDSPANGLAAAARHSWRGTLVLDREG